MSQTLAGRTSVHRLLPLSVSELLGRGPLRPDALDRTPEGELVVPSITRWEIVFRGLYPRVHDEGLDPSRWYADDYRTYVERDLRDVLRVMDLTAFDRFVRAVAASTAQELVLVSELTKAFEHGGREAPLSFWRDASQREIDVLLDLGDRVVPVEIKSGLTVAADAFDGLRAWNAIAGQKTGVLIHGGEDAFVQHGLVARPWFLG